MPASVFNQVTVTAPAGSVAPATQIVDSSVGQSVLVFNTSTTNTVYLSEHNSALSVDAGTPGVTPLGPQQTLVFDGTIDVFAVIAAGQTVVLNLYPTATNYTPFTGIAPLSVMGNFTSPGTSVITVPPSAQVTVFTPAQTGLRLASGPYSGFGAVDVSLYASYDFNAYCFDNNAITSTINVKFIWYDELLTGIPVFQEDWWMWVSSNGAGLTDNPMIATGPMHGRYLVIVLNNSQGAPSFVHFSWVALFGSNRVAAMSDWRQNTQAFAVSGSGTGDLANGIWVPSGTSETAIGSTTFGYDNVMMDIQQPALAVNSVYFFYMPLYAGSVDFHVRVTGPNLPASFQVASAAQNLNPGGWSPPVFKTLFIQAPVAGTNYDFTVILPRAPCVFIVPTSAPGTINLNAYASAQQVF